MKEMKEERKRRAAEGNGRDVKVEHGGVRAGRKTERNGEAEKKTRGRKE